MQNLNWYNEIINNIFKILGKSDAMDNRTSMPRRTENVQEQPQ